MKHSDIDVAVIGGGAAGIAAARKLRDAKIKTLVIEARSRLGGRASTVVDPSGSGLDVGCGWLHSAERNPWVAVAQAQGRTIDKTPPPWSRPYPIGFPSEDQQELAEVRSTLWERIEAMVDAPDRPVSDLLEPNSRWNGMLNAVSSFYSGAEFDRLSTVDLARYDDDGVNWRIIEGYGTTVAAAGAGLDVTLDCAVHRIDHSGKRLRIETEKGIIVADHAIVALPSAIVAETPELFAPALPDKTDAADGLPLGLADKLFLSLAGAEEFDKDSRLVGHTDRTETAIYHLRPFGRPMIEAYFGGTHAHTLEATGERAFFDFAVSELVGLLGSDFARRVKPIVMHRWRADPFARGSYSYAKPGKADCRAALAAPVDGRLFFAGEAVSRTDFSTAHGAWFTGVAAADAIIAARGEFVKAD